MQLHFLKNEELNQRLKSLVHREREVLTEILHHIAEVDRRRLYLEMAYPNLFSYLTEYLGYSTGSAQRRLDAARLMREAPALTEKLESGELNLAQVSLMQKAFRQKKRESHVILPAQSKAELLDSLCGQSMDQSAEILARELDLKLQTAPQIQVQKDRSVRMEITLSESQWQKLQTARELLSHSLPEGSVLPNGSCKSITGNLNGPAEDTKPRICRSFADLTIDSNTKENHGFNPRLWIRQKQVSVNQGPRQDEKSQVFGPTRLAPPPIL